MTRFESPEQAAAFAGLFRDQDACSAFVRDLAHSTIAVTLWRDDSNTPCCTATISIAGTVRTDLAIAA